MMNNSSSQYKPLYKLPVYTKALEIFRLSRGVAAYLSYDKNILQMQTHQGTVDFYAGDLVLDSLGLAPKIAAAETQKNYIVKMKYADSLKKLTSRLIKQCERIELTSTEGKEFVELLRIEIKKFKKLQRAWVATLK